MSTKYKYKMIVLIIPANVQKPISTGAPSLTNFNGLKRIPFTLHTIIRSTVYAQQRIQKPAGRSLCSSSLVNTTSCVSSMTAPPYSEYKYIARGAFDSLSKSCTWNKSCSFPNIFLACIPKNESNAKLAPYCTTRESSQP